ncbi:Tm-1-like ATP-binding domain-containing protein, partial [Klebsiella aerogenes]|uniref:Tm-1-like ATP-binding domain-containing protein n=1 Tax=Klebsiella aerogenes TaxID=548 RepID=UPI0034DB17E3
RLYDKNRIHGVLAVGGNQGTSIATTAMKGLQLGVPKVMVSTVASGNTRPYIGNTDTAMMFSIADILGGPNTVTQTVLANA